MGIYIPRLQQPTWFRFILPGIVFVLLVYSTWSFSHKFCYDQLYNQFGHHTLAIGLICIVCFLDIVVFLLWIQIALTIGPGKQPTVPPFMLVPEDSESNNDTDQYKTFSITPPVCYQSDPSGYPIWCNTCQSLKIDRTHHSRGLGYCIPRFDHYCSWVGTVIGKDNYRLFVQFSMYFSMVLLIFWISICSYIRKIIQNPNNHENPKLNPNIIVVVILAASFSIMTMVLFLSHVYYTMNNKTSIDVLSIKRNNHTTSKKYFCYYNSKDSYRYVVEFTHMEYDGIWDKGSYWINSKEILGSNVFLWLIPINFRNYQKLPIADDKQQPEIDKLLGKYRESLSEKTIELIERKISNEEYVKKLKVYGDKYLNIEPKT